uniref:hypothetical protein n=1 Tax=Eubacterium cellulosolvens TaxID=29322 RepID=UPI0012DD64B1|nr:hypothetical protein [[Eubacterium] cellulosolvens]
MRILIHDSQKDEIPARCDYLYDVFKMYFLPRNSEGNFIPLLPVGVYSLDFLFIIGHSDQVTAYLSNHISSIPEKNIVITSCLSKQFKSYKNKKNIYVPDIPSVLCPRREGTLYGFAFNPSDPELNLYNSTGNIIQRINAAYRLL